MMKKSINSISLIKTGKHLLFLIAVISSTNTTAQKEPKNVIGISVPVVWNSTKIYNSYSGARGKDISGTAFSNGINVTYERMINTNLFAVIGIGKYKQKFGIQRPFDYDDPSTNLLYWTDRYYYECIQYTGGIGYKYEISEKYNLKGLLTYSRFDTYRQEFIPQYTSIEAGGKSQVETKKYSFGKSVILTGKVSRSLTKNIGIGVDLLLPFYNRWRKDLIFREDTDQFYGSKLNVGFGITASYKF